MNNLTCARCNKPAESMDFKPIMTYETHIVVQFWEHMSIDGSAPDQQVAMCRECALKTAMHFLQSASEQEMEFKA